MVNRTQHWLQHVRVVAVVLAALAAAQDCDCADVELAQVYDLLEQHDAILPGQSRPLA